MIRLYGLVGDWIEKGLPHYFYIELNPEKGCEIQNVDFGFIDIMLRLDIMSSREEIQEKEFKTERQHGTVALKVL